MKTKTHLFDLVQSLSRAERRSFVLYVNRYQTKGKKMIVLLYEAIKKQEEYDEEALRKQLKWPGSNFAFQKHELLQCLVDFLHDFDKEIDFRIEVQTLMSQGYILAKRRQHGLAEKMLNKALKLAKESGQVYLIPQIYYLQNISYSEQSSLDKKKQQVRYESLDKMVESAESLVSELKYYRLVQKVYMLHLLDVEKDNVYAQEKFEEIEKEPFFLDDSMATTFLGKNYLFFAKQLYYNAIQQPLDELYYQQKLIDLFEDYPEMLPFRFSPFLSHSFNKILLLSSLAKHGEAFEQLTKVEGYPEKYKDLFTEGATKVYYLMYYSVALNYLIQVYEYEKVIKVLEEEQTQIQKIIDYDESNSWDYYLNAILANFHMGNYEKCLDLIRELEDKHPLGAKAIVYFAIKTIGVLIHFELGQSTLQESSFNALYFFSRKQKLSEPGYKMVLKLLRKLNNLPELEAVEFYKSIYDDFSLDPTINKIERTIKNWLESKIRGVDLSEIVKERKLELEEKIKKEKGTVAKE